MFEDPPQAAVWYQKAADLGHAASIAALGTFFRHGYPSVGIAMDAARGLALFREAVDLGLGLALSHSATCWARAWRRTLRMVCLYCARSSSKRTLRKRKLR